MEFEGNAPGTARNWDRTSPEWKPFSFPTEKTWSDQEEPRRSGCGRSLALATSRLSAAMAGVVGALYGGAESVAGGTNFDMFESLLILAVVAIGGASVCSGALAGTLALGFLPVDAQDVFIGAGTVTLAFCPDGVLPLAYSRLQRWWRGATAPGAAAVPLAGRGAGRDPRRLPGGLNRGGGPSRQIPVPDPARRDCRTPRQPLSFTSCLVRLRPARERHAQGVTFSVSRGSACPQSPSSSARDGRPR